MQVWCLHPIFIIGSPRLVCLQQELIFKKLSASLCSPSLWLKQSRKAVALACQASSELSLWKDELPVHGTSKRIVGLPYSKSHSTAHRTPEMMFSYASSAGDQGIQIIIAGAGGAAHLPGMIAAVTPLPVIGVPISSSSLDEMNTLLSTVQMPRGVPVAGVAIENTTNAGLLGVRTAGVGDSDLIARMSQYQEDTRDDIQGVTIHWYDKSEMRKQQKMGHLTIAGPSMGIEDEVTTRVGMIVGSDSDLPIMKDAARILTMLCVPHEVKIVSAHQTPEMTFSYASSARDRGIQVIIAGAGGAAHLPGMVAAVTPLPVIGVPIHSSSLDEMDTSCQLSRRQGEFLLQALQ